MPVRSLSSRVLVWPSQEAVRLALVTWSREQAALRPELLRVGLFGSYARGNPGVGSDLDLVLVVESCAEPWERRTSAWDTLSLPVPVDAVVYTQPEWDALVLRKGSLPSTIAPYLVWVYSRAPVSSVDRNRPQG